MSGKHAVILIALCANISLGQERNFTSRISLRVAENTGGIFQSTVANALRRLQGVEVVSGTENADYAWQLTVLCDSGPDGVERCDNTSAYAVAYSIRRPMAPINAASYWVRGQLFLKSGTADIKKLFQGADTLFKEAHFYSSDVLSGVARVGRRKYEEMFTDMVRKFDASCLERDRINQRLIAEQNFKEMGAATADLPKDMCSY